MEGENIPPRLTAAGIGAPLVRMADEAQAEVRKARHGACGVAALLVKIKNI